MTWIIRYFLRHDPALLARRLQHRIAGEKTALQKALQISGQLCFLGTLLVACLDHRFGWSHLPVPLVVAGELLVACCLGGMFLVFRENTYASVLIEVAPRQTVVSTGPYRIVRHPVYAVGLLFIGGMPLALGSAWALLFLLPVAAVLLVRLTDEEKFLVEHLPGYAEYRTHTRFRLIPGIF